LFNQENLSKLFWMEEQTMSASRGTISADSRARQVMETIARNGPLTIRQLVDAVGVTTTAIREQVVRLTEEGWLIRSQQHGAVGRPADVYALSRRAMRLFGGRADGLARVLVETIIEELGPARGREVLRAASHRLADRVEPGLRGESTADRLRQLEAALRETGDIVEADMSGGRMRLTVFTCPYGGNPDEHGELCEMESQTFSELVGKPVTLARRRSDRHPCCEFVIAGTGDLTGRKPDQEQP
jgi:predicted ArsR family transcriptional regulator